MRKVSKTRVEEDAISSHNGSTPNDDQNTSATKRVVDDEDADNSSDIGNEETDGGHKSESSSRKSKSKSKGKKKKEKAVEEEYEVERIVDAKKIKGKLHYLIRWKGYDADNDTWEPENTVSCPELVNKFYEEKENSKDKKTKKADKKGASKRKSKKDVNKTPAKRTKTDWDSSKDDANAEYEVERILEVHFKKNGKREFLIHWKGWSSKFDSWEPESNLNCSELIKKFMEKVDAARTTDSRNLRVNPETTNRFTLQDPTAGRRLSKRRGQRQRVRYDNAE